MHKKFGKVALLANGAGALGLGQSAMMQAFVDHGVPYDSLYGSSAGSLNGSFLHSGDLDGLHQVWKELRNKDIMAWHPIILNLMGEKACLYDSSPMLKTIRKYVNPAKLRSNPKDFFIGATNQTKWEASLFNVKDLTDDEIYSALHASASVPVFFPAVKIRGEKYIDAGVNNNYDIMSAIKDGCDTLVLLGFSKPAPKDPRNVIDNLGQVMGMMMHGHMQIELNAVEKINQVIAEPGGPDRLIKVVKIIPDKDLGIELLDFDMKGKNRQAIWDYCYELARNVLEQELV